MTTAVAAVDAAAAREEEWAAVPYLDAMIQRIATTGAFRADLPIRILDLAAGSGRLSAKLLARHANAQAVLLEPSAALRAAAHQRLSAAADRVEITELAFAHAELPRGFDLVVSLFGFFALEDIARRAAYRAIYSALSPNGMLLIGDVARSAGASLESHNQDVWRAEAERGGVDAELLARAQTRFAGGRGMWLTNELPWLANVGFRDVEVHYKNLGFVVFGGRRPVASEFVIGEDGSAGLRRRPRG